MKEGSLFYFVVMRSTKSGCFKSCFILGFTTNLVLCFSQFVKIDDGNPKVKAH
jgi:hypothetical protein